MNGIKLAAASAALCLSGTAFAAELGSGILSLSNTAFGFAAGPIAGTNATNAAGLECIDPLLPCDTVSLSTDLPLDVGEYFPTALVRVTVAPTDNPSGLDDYDLRLTGADGNVIAESASEGANEAVSTIALGDMHDYTVTIIHWLVLGGSYSVNLELSLGLPSEDKSDEEVAQWLEDNGGSDTMIASARAAENCAAPGLTILEDAAGDVDVQGLSPLAIPADMFDLLGLNVYQVGHADDPADPELIAFHMSVASLETALLPNSAYFTSFNVGGATYGARMAVDEQGGVSFFTYVPSANNDGGIDGRFVGAGSERPANAQSYYSPTEIVIFVRPQDIGLIEPGQTLSGFNGGSTLSIGAPGVGGLVAFVMDDMPDGLGRQGLFTYLSEEECAMDDESEDGTSASGRSFVGTTKGGATGLGALLMLLGLGLRRRVKARS